MIPASPEGPESGGLATGVLEDLRWRGLVHQVTDESLGAVLATQRVSVYLGLDPTADSLHLGNLMQLMTLRRLHRAGHMPIAVVGGGTAMIGDPGGRADERPLLGVEELKANYEAVAAQVRRFLCLEVTPPATPGEPGAHQRATGADDAGVLVLDNGEWLGPMTAIEFMRDVGKHFTVNQMVAKESVRSRMVGRRGGISFTEFSYMLLQARDFLHLFDAHGCRLQIGGSDQWGNITMGVDLVRKVTGETVYGLTTPLLLKPDGTKFGKSASGNVWLAPARTSPYSLYQFLLRSDDAIAGDLLRYYTELGRGEIGQLESASRAHPESRAAQKALAMEVTAMVHGKDEAVSAERAASLLYSEHIDELGAAQLEEVFADVPSTAASLAELAGGPRRLVELLVEAGLCQSISAARRAISQGGIYVNNHREADGTRLVGPSDLLRGRYLVLRRGRREQHVVRFG
ncbi:MAG: tyrosine--tRNA ligase [Acidimicrobiales bacterium]